MQPQGGRSVPRRRIPQQPNTPLSNPVLTSRIGLLPTNKPKILASLEKPRGCVSFLAVDGRGTSYTQKHSPTLRTYYFHAPLPTARETLGCPRFSLQGHSHLPKTGNVACYIKQHLDFCHWLTVELVTIAFLPSIPISLN